MAVALLVAPPVAEDLSDDALNAVVGERVVVKANGREHVGRLDTVWPDRIVVADDDGQIIEIDKADIDSVKSAPTVEPEPPAPTCPEAACDFPQKCIDGKCRLEVVFDDALHAKGEKRRRGGIISMIVGGVAAGAGIVLIGVGAGVRSAAETDIAERTMGTFEEYEALQTKSDRGGYVLISGGALLGVGAVALVVGGVMYALGKRDLEASKRYALTPRGLAF